MEEVRDGVVGITVEADVERDGMMMVEDDDGGRDAVDDDDKPGSGSSKEVDGGIVVEIGMKKGVSLVLLGINVDLVS